MSADKHSDEHPRTDSNIRWHYSKASTKPPQLLSADDLYRWPKLNRFKRRLRKYLQALRQVLPK